MRNFKILSTFSLYIILILFFNKVEAQNIIDTTGLMPQEINDSVRISVLQEKTELHFESSPSKAFERASEALELSLLYNDEKLKARSLRNMGLSHMYLFFDYEKALEYCFEALRIEENMKFSESEALTLEAIATIYEEVGNYLLSVDMLQKSLTINKAVDKQENISNLHNKIGKLFSKLEKYDSALTYHHKALEYEIAMENKKGEANALNSIANIYTTLGLTDDAYLNHTNALKIRRAIGDKEGEALSLNYIADIYKKKENYERALKNHEAALQIWERLKNKKRLTETFNCIGEINLLQKQYGLAIENLQKGLNSALEINDTKSIRFSYDQLYSCHLAQNNYKKALESKNYFLAIEELIQSEENDKKVTELQSLYDLNKKESEIMALKINQQIKEMELKDKESFHNFLILLLISVTVIIFLILYMYRHKQKSNLQLTHINEEIKEKNQKLNDANVTKDKFFSIIAHDLKGPLNSLTSFSNLLINHTSSLSQEEIQLVAKDLDKSVRNLFNLLDNLLEWSRSQTGILGYYPENLNLTEIVNNTFHLLKVSAVNKNISLETSISDHILVLADKNATTTVIRNLISNSIKFTKPGGKIEVGAVEGKDSIHIMIKDNGVGMSAEVMDKIFRIDKKHSSQGTSNEKGTGLGLILCKEFVEKNGGKLSVESKENVGTIFKVTLPKAEMEGQLVLQLN